MYGVSNEVCLTVNKDIYLVDPEILTDLNGFSPMWDFASFRDMVKTGDIRVDGDALLLTLEQVPLAVDRNILMLMR